MLWTLVAIGTAYALGSIPTSVLTGRVLAGIDLRDRGSGNAGAANTLRVLGWKPALFVLAVDAGKGALAVAVGLAVARASGGAVHTPWIGIACAAAAVAGHLWPVFAGFRGGKGVATIAGSLAVLEPAVLASCLGGFVLVAVASRRIAVASVAAACGVPVAMLLARWLGRPISPALLAFGWGVAVLVVVTHRSNLRRLLQGEEPTVGERPGAQGPPDGRDD